jgi:hypothetical protein
MREMLIVCKTSTAQTAPVSNTAARALFYQPVAVRRNGPPRIWTPDHDLVLFPAHTQPRSNLDGTPLVIEIPDRRNALYPALHTGRR